MSTRPERYYSGCPYYSVPDRAGVGNYYGERYYLDRDDWRHWCPDASLPDPGPPNCWSISGQQPFSGFRHYGPSRDYRVVSGGSSRPSGPPREDWTDWMDWAGSQ
ncbi:hypothetical protein GTA08_BOTSDO04950 [Botryosphaeria dothidea]|uniref:Uncharacterized protein n=1 Tax=Botryosphaeria dothidea TaxID=55169 RepID=A0A8H4IS08_9PEZI|nr:hypothetical protein GTA08_BOTSDO04950 [Botryosphaeria dothidea]